MSPSPSAPSLISPVPRRGDETVARHSPTAHALVGEFAAILAAADRLAKIEDGSELMRAAVEFARLEVGIERVGIYLVESLEPQIVMRGTWGTNDRGATADERGLAHVYDSADFESLRSLHERGELWEYRSLEPHGTDRRCLPWTREDRDWLAITPIVTPTLTQSEIVGVFYNDTAVSRVPLDSGKQVRLAVFGSLLGGLIHKRPSVTTVDRKNPHGQKISRFTHKILAEVEREPQLSGEELASRFRVSAGHLARTFKAEVGTSLVDYRNRLRLERFFNVMRSGQANLNEAALRAGFGSYAQFIRVHRQVTGFAPREYAVSGAQNDT